MSKRKGIEVVSKKTIAYGSEWIEAISNNFGLNLDFSKEEFERVFQKN